MANPRGGDGGDHPSPQEGHKNIFERKWKYILRQKANFYILAFTKTILALHKMH